MRAGIFASARVASGGGGSPVTATFQHSENTGSLNIVTFTFTAVPIGTASSTRRVVVGLGTNSTRTVSSATIGGVTATIDGTVALSGTARVAFISAVVPTGTTANVVVTLDASGIGMGIGVWTLDTGAPTGQVATGNGDPTGLTVSGSTAGGAVLAYAWTTGVGTALFAWSGATERYEQDVYSTTVTHSGADVQVVGSSTAISVDPSASTTVGIAVEYA